MHNKENESWLLVFLLRSLSIPVPLLCYLLYDPFSGFSFWNSLFAIFIGLIISFSAVLFANSIIGRGAYLIEFAYFLAMYAFVLYPNKNIYPFWMSFMFYSAGLAEGAAILVHAICFNFKKLDLYDDDTKPESKEKKREKTIHHNARVIVPLTILVVGIISSVICYNIGTRYGYEDGSRIGYDDGYVDGYTDGETAGYDDGYDDGYAEGESHGYDRGYDSGYDTGSALGKRDGDPNYLVPSTSTTYIGNLNTGKFHRSSCSYLPNPENQTYFYSRDAAINAGYDPCGRCHP